MAPEERVRVAGCDVLLLGTVAGFVPDAARVEAAFVSHRPTAVALGAPPEDLSTLDALAKGPVEDMAQPDARADRLLQLLGRFGPTRVPSPDLEAAHALARADGLPLEGVDLDDAAHSAEYVQRVKVRHLWMAPRREKKLLARAFDEVADAYQLAAAWDEAANASKPLLAIERLREETMAAGIRRLAAGQARVLAILPAPRLAGVARRLRAPPGAPGEAPPRP